MDESGYRIGPIDINELNKRNIIRGNDEGLIGYNKEYKVGEKIEFADSNWYVIEDSPSNQDYVTIIKDDILTVSDLGQYAILSGVPRMAYYYDDYCHLKNTYGYSDTVYSGCSGHNNYAGSKVRGFLEGTYINTLEHLI